MIDVRVESSITAKRTQQGMTEMLVTAVSIKSSCLAKKHNAKWFPTLVYSFPIMDRRAKQAELTEELNRLSKSFKVCKLIHVESGEPFGTVGKNRLKKNRTILGEFATRFKLGGVS